MMRAEFAIYPFHEGEVPPAHVQAANERLRQAGIDVDIGLLGEVVRGDIDTVLEALRMATGAAIEAGATKVVVSIEVVSDDAG
ncbi:MAG: thiamine-binding protein [Actinomycetota bacterium]